VCSLSDSKLIELEDFLTNNFGEIWLQNSVHNTLEGKEKCSRVCQLR
jgi:hypothetical protein